MSKLVKKINIFRWISQTIGTILPNLNYKLFTAGQYLYQGPLKKCITLNFNCYSCPLSTTACPIGSMQHFITLKEFSYYTAGSIIVYGALFGRAICGWFCPIGLLQDLLSKITKFKLKLPRLFEYMKYFWLVVVTILVVYFTGETWYCKLCPVGGFQAGIPQVLLNPDLRSIIGTLFIIKMVIVGIFILSSIIISRPYCRYMCPLGAIYSLFNRISFVKIKFIENRCTFCSLCEQKCPVDINPIFDYNSTICIRCFECVRVCPKGALKVSIF